MRLYRKRSIYGRRKRSYRRKTRRTRYKRRRRYYGRRKTFRRYYKRFARRYRYKRQPKHIWHTTETAIVELNDPAENAVTNMFTQNEYQRIQCPNSMAAFKTSEIVNYIDYMFNSNAPAFTAYAGPSVVVPQQRDLTIRMAKGWAHYECTNLGNFPTHVQVYCLKPRRNLDSQEITSAGEIVSTYMTSQSMLGEQTLAGSAAINSATYGITPYHFPEVTARFKIKLIFNQLMPPGAVGSWNIRATPREFNAANFYSLWGDARLDNVYATKQMRFCMIRAWTIPLGMLTGVPVTYTISPGPIYLGIIKDEWWKMQMNFAGSYSTFLQDVLFAPAGGVNPTNLEYMNPDTGAPQQFAEADG